MEDINHVYKYLISTLTFSAISHYCTNFRFNCGTDPLTCSFEQNLCNWKQSRTDKFDWSRRSGGTPSSNTGPSQSSTGAKGMVFASVTFVLSQNIRSY